MRTIKELSNLKNRVALITGGAGHIGQVIADGLAEQGAQLVILDADVKRCSKVADELAIRWGVQTLPLAIDLADEDAVRSVPGRVLEALGRLDIIIHCAALVGTSALKGWVTPFEEQSAETWRAAFEVNLTATFILTQACTPALRDSGNGSIISIGSIYGMVGPDLRLYEGTGMGHPAAYAASKGGLLQFTRWLSAVLAPDIRANMISLGGIERGQPESFQQRYLDRTPMKRLGTEEDIKGAAIYLASDLSAYVTGQNLVIDGGWTAW